MPPRPIIKLIVIKCLQFLLMLGINIKNLGNKLGRNIKNKSKEDTKMMNFSKRFCFHFIIQLTVNQYTKNF